MTAPLSDPPASLVEALRRIAHGSDAIAWNWLVVREGPSMFRVALRVIGSAAAADDACQEAFLHLRRGAHRFRPSQDGDPESAARAWLQRIAANAAAMHLRSERRRARRERIMTGPAAAQPCDDSAVDALREAIAALPDSQRQPLVLHHIGGQDYTAIGAALGISPGAARVRAHRGLESLRSRLAQAGLSAGVLGLLGRTATDATAMPADAGARWAAALTSTSTPAATSAAIFGGISTMAKFTILGATLSAAVLSTLALSPAQAEERRVDPPRAEIVSTEPVKEAHDAMAEGTKGVSEGVIISLAKGKLVLATEQGNLLFMPHWRGGAHPADKGGLDKGMLERLDAFTAGQRVTIAWTWSERRRIESINVAKTSTK